MRGGKVPENGQFLMSSFLDSPKGEMLPFSSVHSRMIFIFCSFPLSVNQ